MSIVNIGVSVTSPPVPSQLLKTGAFVSQGGTTLTAGSYQVLQTSLDLAQILSGAKAIASITWLSNVVTVTLSAAHGWTVGDTFLLTVAGVAPTGYNGTIQATVTTATAFTYPLTTNPGAATTMGTVTDEDVTELTEMNTTFWAQGSLRSVYVLELGQGSPAEGVTALAAFIANDMAAGVTYQKFSAYLVPRTWDTEPTFKPLCSLYTSPSEILYFFVTTTTSTYSAWTALAYKSAYVGVESPGAAATEFKMASDFYNWLVNDPGSSNLVPPMAWRFVYGLTIFPMQGNVSLLTSLQTANINYTGTSAEGGLTNAMLCRGHTLDGKSMNYWYSVGWAIINLGLDLANEIINGSNTTTNPLYYNQDGIDRLQKRALKTIRNGISYGLFLGQAVSSKQTQVNFVAALNNGTYYGNAVINAVPFSSYTSLNPSDYQAQKYNGLSGAITPQLGFESITFNLNVINFAG